MMNIKILCLGKLKENYWKEAETEYLKRLRQYAKIEIVEIPEEAFSSVNEREQIQIREAKKLESHISSGEIVIALHERGKEFDSVNFAKFLEQKSSHGEHLVFVIGGPLGLHKDFLDTVHAQFSLSALTFPHQMVRTILLEQLYRAQTILHEKQYHY